MQEPVAVLSGQFKLGRQRKHGLVEVSEHRFDRGGVLVAVVDVVVQTDELPVAKRCFRTKEGKKGKQRSTHLFPPGIFPDVV